jgi:hypothetical protein
MRFTGRQKPKRPQDWQGWSHADWQQTPSAQKPDMHSLDVVHITP